jgi:hypothetical protein
MGTVKDPLSSRSVYPKKNRSNGTQQDTFKKTKTRIVYPVACQVCGYKYILALFTKYDYECCPVCGYCDSLASFISEGKRRWEEIVRISVL